MNRSNSRRASDVPAVVDHPGSLQVTRGGHAGLGRRPQWPARMPSASSSASRMAITERRRRSPWQCAITGASALFVVQHFARDRPKRSDRACGRHNRLPISSNSSLRPALARCRFSRSSSLRIASVTALVNEIPRNSASSAAISVSFVVLDVQPHMSTLVELLF